MILSLNQVVDSEVAFKVVVSTIQSLVLPCQAQTGWLQPVLHELPVARHSLSQFARAVLQPYNADLTALLEEQDALFPSASRPEPTRLAAAASSSTP